MIGIKSLVTGLGDVSDVDVDWARLFPAGPLRPQKRCSRIRGVTGDTSGSSLTWDSLKRLQAKSLNIIQNMSKYFRCEFRNIWQ